MSSASLRRWERERAADLDRIEAARAALGGLRDRRLATAQIDRAYVVLLSSHFQGFCRDLHSESVDHMAGAVQADDARNQARQERIDRLSEWRNAIAHQAFPPHLVPAALSLPLIRVWRASCQGLARSFDRVMASYLAEIAGSPPW